jgi:hypothetical protein
MTGNRRLGAPLLHLAPSQGDEALVDEALGAGAQEFVRQHADWARHTLESPFEALGRVDPLNLAQAGWAVIFAQDADPRVHQALEPLLTLRRAQAGDLFREFSGANGYRRGERRQQFLARARCAPGPVDPKVLPYYLLLVGPAEEIPFSFQCLLSVQFAVGRLAFERPEQYAAYARALIDVEQGHARRPRRAAIFGPCNPGDAIGALAHTRLARPVADVLKQEPGWRVDPLMGPAATRARLLELLGAHAPALLFSAGHGVAMPNGDPDQRALQGALVCQDWDRRVATEPSIDQVVCAEDVAPEADLRGLVVFSLACFSGGTPRYDSFVGLEAAAPREIAPHDFVAALPQALLSNPGGPALAMIGHVDLAYEEGFRWLPEGDQPVAYIDALQRLLAGEPVGRALQPFGQRYAELSAELAELQRCRTMGFDYEPAEVARVWQATRDAFGWVVLGDPAARVGAAPQAAAA